MPGAHSCHGAPVPTICVVFALDRQTGIAYYRIKGDAVEHVQCVAEAALKLSHPTNRYDMKDAAMPEQLALAKPDLMRVSIGYLLSEEEFSTLKAASSPYG